VAEEMPPQRRRCHRSRGDAVVEEEMPPRSSGGDAFVAEKCFNGAERRTCGILTGTLERRRLNPGRKILATQRF
jgi:hypothetical protein